MKLLISGGTIIDPKGGPDDGYEGPGDLLIEDGRITEILRPGTGPKDIETYDATDLFVAPGLVDIHTHLREPGYEYKETIATGTRAAAAGGVTSVVCMANTKPVNDNEETTKYILDKAKSEGIVNVYPVGAVTVGLGGKTLSEMDKLKEAGVVAFSDDGSVVSDSSLMRRGMERARYLGLPVITHSEDMSLVADGVMNEGAVSSELGLAGNSSAAEEIMIFRDVTLAGLTGARLHVAHVSTAGGVRVIRDAKERGIPVTCETCPHYLTLTDENVRGLNTNFKVNPPLRTKEDREAVIEGISDGTIDIIASDHAPHSKEEKSVEQFKDAPSGMIGLETIFSVSMGLVHEGKLKLADLIRKLTREPADIVGIPAGRFSRGAPADVIIFDPDEEWVVSPDDFLSKGKNTPFSGWKLKGKVKSTFVGGRLVYKEGNFV